MNLPRLAVSSAAATFVTLALVACSSSDNTVVTPQSDAGKGDAGDVQMSNDAASSSSTSISGTVQGVSLAGLKTALADVSTDPSNGSITITITDSETCGSVASGATKGAQFLELTLSVAGTDDAGASTTTAPTGPGTFSASDDSGNYAYAEYDVLDSSCASVNSKVEKWRAGSVIVTRLAGGVISGTFDLTGGDISNGVDHLTGSFTTASCPGSAALAFPTSGGTCN